jgi:hypothetical protein
MKSRCTTNRDYAIDGGGDILPEVEFSAGGGLSVDLDKDTGKPVKTSVGQQFATENKIGLGVSALPFPIDIGGQTGMSETTAEIFYQVPWWH